MREFDACGIGFVADAQGRPSTTVLRAALRGLARVKHRGAVAADSKSADGSGVLTTIPSAIFGEGNGVAALFVRTDQARDAVEAALAAESVELVEWRLTPTDDDVLGVLAQGSRPEMIHAVFGPAPAGPDPEIVAYRVQRRLAGVDGLYVASCSYRTIVYKGLAAADLLGEFYLDLRDDRFEVPIAVFHQRFSTNTLPDLGAGPALRHPLPQRRDQRHPGQSQPHELTGRAGHRGRRPRCRGAVSAPPRPVTTSDSGQLDAALELLVRGGRSLRHAVAMLVPQAWENARDLDPAVRGFYRYHSALMEPWDGPAGLVFTDGIGVGAALDRNGLRPLRYAVCEDGLVVCASEVGAVDLERPRHRASVVASAPARCCSSRPRPASSTTTRSSRSWPPPGRLRHLGVTTASAAVPGGDPVPADAGGPRSPGRSVHGYTKEEIAMVLRPMATDAKEPTFSMGDDSPLPPMAGRPRPVHHYLQAAVRPGHEPARSIRCGSAGS